MRRLIGAAMGTVLAISALAPGSAALAQGPTSAFVVYVGNGCVSGSFASPNDTLTMTRKDAHGHLKDTESAVTDGSGQIDMDNCFGGVRIGDRIKATNGSISHTLRVPRLTVRVERVTDVISGRAPGMSDLAIDICHRTDLTGCSNEPTLHASVSSTGHYSKDATATVDILGQDAINVTWTGTHGDTVGRYAPGPFITAYIGEQHVDGQVAAGQKVKVTLRSATGVKRATGSGKGSYGYGSYSAEMMKNGHDVTIKAGNKVRADFASDAHFTMPSMSIGTTNSNDHVNGHCFANSAFVAYAYSPSFDQQSWSYGTTDGLGNFDVDMSNVDHPDFDLVAGDSVKLTCRTPAGDSVAMYSTP